MASSRSESARRGFSLFGILLVALGTVLLLNTVGILPFRIWRELADYWPVLLVLVGVKVLLAPRAPLLGIGVVALIVSGVVAAAFVTVPEYRNDEPPHVTYVEPLGNTEILRLGMGFAGGTVELTSDSSTASSVPTLIAADFGNRPAEVIRDQSGRVTDIYLSTSGLDVAVTIDDGKSWDVQGPDLNEFNPGLSVGGFVDWRLMISPDVALELEINAGAADLDLDLQDLNVRKVVVGAGASDIRILLPANAGRTSVEIAAGAADVEIVVPDGVAARIENEIVLSSTHIDSDRFFETFDGFHQSPDYSTASNRVDIEIEGFAADVTIS